MAVPKVMSESKDVVEFVLSIYVDIDDDEVIFVLSDSLLVLFAWLGSASVSVSFGAFSSIVEAASLSLGVKSVVSTSTCNHRSGSSRLYCEKSRS